VTVKFVGRIISGLGLAFAANLLATVPAWAQRFTVSPLVTIVETKSGQAKGSITVVNQGTDTLRMRVYAESFTYDRKQGFTFTAKDDRSAVPYLQFSPREIEIPPGVTRNIRVAVTLPANLPNQEYRVAVFIEDLKERATKPTNSGNVLLIRARVASVFFFSKGSSTAAIQSRMAMWDATSNKISILLENQGSRSAYPEVEWRIEKDGKEVAKDVIRGVIVQSQNSREIALQTGDKSLVLASGEYKISGNILVRGQKPVPFNLRVVVP
jgi:P pilus assembly chaperone PapD